MKRPDTPIRYGGHTGLAASICMLSLTGCMAFTQKAESLTFYPPVTRTQVETAQLIQGPAIPPRAPAATFIVRFNGEPELEQVCRNFRRDEAGTRATFQNWAADHPQLQGLRLVRASYSGELILALPQSDPAQRSPADIIAALETIESLAYAEVDSLASTNEER